MITWLTSKLKGMKIKNIILPFNIPIYQNWEEMDNIMFEKKSLYLADLASKIIQMTIEYMDEYDSTI